MKNNKQWFSLVIALWLIVLISVIALSVLEYIVPFSKNVKGLENSAKSYYLSTSWVEEALFYVNSRSWSQIWNESSDSISWLLDYGYNTYSSWVILPPVWEGDSDYDSNYNKISVWNPIQLEIGYDFYSDLSDLDLNFNIPNLDSIQNETLSGSSDKAYIAWQISWSWNFIQSSSWTHITKSDIASSNIDFYLKDLDLDDFYNNNCANSCILKFTIIDNLEVNLTWWIWWSTKAPYLEWGINNNWSSIPLRYTIIETKWNSYWFSTNQKIRFAQDTISEAFDFTVFQ